MLEHAGTIPRGTRLGPDRRARRPATRVRRGSPGTDRRARIDSRRRKRASGTCRGVRPYSPGSRPDVPIAEGRAGPEHRIAVIVILAGDGSAPLDPEAYR